MRTEEFFGRHGAGTGNIRQVDKPQKGESQSRHAGQYPLDRLLAICTLVVILSGLFWKVGQIPHGIFADEALIGLYAREFVTGHRDASLLFLTTMELFRGVFHGSQSRHLSRYGGCPRSVSVSLLWFYA